MVNVRGQTKKKDGMRVRLYWRKKPSKVMTVAVSVVVGVAAWAGDDSTKDGAAKPSSGNHARSARITPPADAQAGFERARTRLSASGHKVGLSTKSGTDCAAHSSGKVHEFFLANPCTWLARACVVVGDSEVLVAISWVGMPDASSAEKYEHLVGTPGAGNVTELSHDITLYRHLGYAGSAHSSGIDGTAVWSVEVRPVYPRPNALIGEILTDSRQ
jgi:hypothetical protein